MGISNSKSIAEVRKFWEENPLFQGEIPYETGTKEWFTAWEKITIADAYLGQGPEEIYTKDLSPDANILDVGCGPGFWVRYFLKKGFLKLSACDLTYKAAALTQTSLRLFDFPGNPHLIVANAEELPYCDGTFDHINCQGVIHHTPNTKKCLEEFHRLLKPGGTLCFSIYYKVFLLRHPALLKAFCRVFARAISMQGRGRESILLSGTAEEIIRQYDGKDNPIGRAYTKQDVNRLLEGLFEVKEVQRSFFPARSLPFRIPSFLHRWLHRRHGFLLVYRVVKKT